MEHDMNTNFGFGKRVNLDFDGAIAKVTAALAEEGYGVLTDIDVAATMKKKIDKQMPRYRILCACNPSLAYEAINRMPEIGLLLPCNVVVREDVDNKVHVSFLDPERMLGLADAPDLETFAADVKSRLERVAEQL
jgi:uncharacterized protein (DUF302 family)